MSRRRSALLWGSIGGLSFLVFAQGATLAGVRLPVDLLGKLAVAVAVGAVAAAASYAVERRIGG